MGKPANFKILWGERYSILLLRDIGPWDEHLTITDDAEGVVEKLRVANMLKGQALYYYDSEGELVEIEYSYAFEAFKSVTKEQAEAIGIRFTFRRRE